MTTTGAGSTSGESSSAGVKRRESYPYWIAHTLDAG
jgi:hypothetical protein